MTTRLEKITDLNKDGVLKQAANVIINGGLVAFPTETVYGLGANAFNEEAAKKIFMAKGRPQDNPLIVHIQSTEELPSVTANISNTAKSVIDCFWPGPLTLILPKNNNIPNAVTCGLSTVAVRMPDNETALQLIKEAGLPIAAPSANSSGKPSPTEAGHVYEDLNGKIDYIIDCGSAVVGIESTILDMTVDPPTILRPGAVTRDMLLTVLDTVILLDSTNIPNIDLKPKAPGMKYTHYAPSADVTIASGELEQITEKIKNFSIKALQKGQRVGILATTETKDMYSDSFVLDVGSRKNPNEIAANLFSCLRKFDYESVDVIYAEALPDYGIFGAVMNRLLKAASYRVV